MKCIQCGTDNNLRDRTANLGRCKNCYHPFAFEPTSMGKLKFTDPFFAKALNDISANNTLFFTPKQFLYLLDQRLKRKKLSLVVIIFLYLYFNIWATLFIDVICGLFPLVSALYNLGWIFYLFDLSNSPQSSYQTRKCSATALILHGTLIFVIGGLISLAFSSAISFFLAILLGLSAVGLGIVHKRKAAEIPNSFLISAAQMGGWLDQWRRANGEVTQMLSASPTTAQLAVESSTPPPDVTAYSFDRLVVCDSEEIAQMLIANNFHFENNCAILSISGYPQSIFETIMTMLRRNPELRVFALHDCSPAGMEVVHQLRTDRAWFAASDVVIVDIGLLPRQIMAAGKNMFVLNSHRSAQAAQDLAPEIRQTLSHEELQWLDAGNLVELESFTPQTLIRILQRSIASGLEIDEIATGLEINEADSGLLLMGGGAYGYIYALDSFG
ncbi:MAG: hypothetical protein AB4426_28320 [Xenococcaceae cyanobacterium]